MREVIDGYFCLREECNKELENGVPPCCECEELISISDFAEIMNS